MAAATADAIAYTAPPNLPRRRRPGTGFGAARGRHFPKRRCAYCWRNPAGGEPVGQKGGCRTLPAAEQAEPAGKANEGVHQERGNAGVFAGLAAGVLPRKTQCRFLLRIPTLGGRLTWRVGGVRFRGTIEVETLTQFWRELGQTRLRGRPNASPTVCTGTG